MVISLVWIALNKDNKIPSTKIALFLAKEGNSEVALDIIKTNLEIIDE